jgi:hypothetical protein
LQAAAANRPRAAFGADDGDPDATARTSGNLVVVDEATGSYWSQLLAEAICRPQTGDELRIRPPKVDTCEEWRPRRPSTKVLLPPPHSGTV